MDAPPVVIKGFGHEQNSTRLRGDAHLAQMAAGRALYESMPGATFDLVGKELGVNGFTVKRWKHVDAKRGIVWKRNAYEAIPNLSTKAQALADTFAHRMSEMGKPMSDQVAANEAAQELAETEAVSMRARILDRHRQEWAAPRKIAYEAIKDGNFDKAKLAKITAETLTLIQTGECRAYGIDVANRLNGGGTVVTIDRGGARQVRTIEEEAGEAADSIEMPAEIRNAASSGPVTGDTSTSDDAVF